MPYIRPVAQARIDHGAKPIGADVGELTYRLQQVIDGYLRARLLCAGTVRYSDLAACLGAMEGCRADFERRILTPYEVKKQKENGDVWSPGVLREVTEHDAR